MSFLTHLNAITRGVLDLRDVLFFVLTALFWLAVNLLVLRARKGGE
jgi:ABC-2 type transport system permease protein